jgi:hypothetical protein
MTRREFIALAGSAIAWPIALTAQQPGKVYRLALFSAGPPPRPRSGYAAFFGVLRDLGLGILAFLSALAQDERERILKRSKEDGLKHAKARGVHCGRPPALNDYQRCTPIKRASSGAASQSHVGWRDSPRSTREGRAFGGTLVTPNGRHNSSVPPWPCVRAFMRSATFSVL